MPEQPLNSGSLFTRAIACRVQRDPPLIGRLRNAALHIREDAAGQRVFLSSAWDIQILKNGYSLVPAPCHKNRTFFENFAKLSPKRTGIFKMFSANCPRALHYFSALLSPFLPGTQFAHFSPPAGYIMGGNVSAQTVSSRLSRPACLAIPKGRGYPLQSMLSQP
jgi:hypothetical protein